MNLTLDTIYEICKWSLPVYRAVIYNRQFHEYMSAARILTLQDVHVVCNGDMYTLCGRLHRNGGPAAIVDDGAQVWAQFGKIHRDDGPAITDKDGILLWVQYDEVHREDGPAIIHPGGIQTWYHRGEIHRDGAPAEVSYDGTEKWYQHGKLHRVGAPAIVYPNGDYEWFQDGNLHREDGPALENIRYRSWYLKGVIQYTETKMARFTHIRPVEKRSCVII